MRRYRNVPPLQFLQGFEAAARLGSFSKAAAELGLSQSAVSHQMRLLEDRLGQKLFLRVGRHIGLTDAGRDYSRTVSRALADLETGYRRLEPFRKPRSVVIYAPREFAHRWLLPRLQDLLTQCPGACPWIDTSEIPVDFEEMEVSLAIIRAEKAPADREVLELMDDRVGPVLSPKLATGVRDARDLILQLPRLHSEHAEHWEEWFEAAGMGSGQPAGGLDFSDRDLALAAAERGLGWALASLPMAGHAIRSGALVAPFDAAIAPAARWFAISTARELADPDTSAIWRWLRLTAAGSLGE
jgi:LysR family glycine cleavage system transcriptional activator